METRFFDLSRLSPVQIVRLMAKIAPNAEGYLNGSLYNKDSAGRYRLILRERCLTPGFENLSESELVGFLRDGALPREVCFKGAGDPMYHGTLSLDAALKVADRFMTHGYTGTLWMHLHDRSSRQPSTDLRFRLNDLPVDGFDHDRRPWRLRIDTSGYAIESITETCRRFELEEYVPDTAPA